ncbi:hypothetical protein PGIGA_G00009600 [Pangasianodon gigas]|uniref:Uncharacterized protein n=1 Tax=Pangasianodon gigas TaxID=30993 RepID=A0ACC5W797_PANGG|nr:hypothetical protein [Pangasianodon gigas]
MEENYSSLQEFTEDSHSATGNKPILYTSHNGQAGTIKRVEWMRRQMVIFLIITLITSLCVNIALAVFLVKRKPSSPPSMETTQSPLSEEGIQSLQQLALMERFSRLCADYTSLGKTCSTEVKQCMPCPDGWRHIEEKCYFFSDDKLDWIRSKESCASMNSHLTILHTHEQHLALEKIARSLSGFDYYYWIGLSDIEEEGVWKWVDNTLVNKTYWNEWDGEPNNHQSGGLHGEDCAVLNSHSKSWFDVPCDHIYKRISCAPLLPAVQSEKALFCCRRKLAEVSRSLQEERRDLTLLCEQTAMEVDQLLSLSGSALAQAISSLLETPGLYVFSDILELPNVRELETGPHAPVYQLLNLFAYGTYSDYKERAASLPELTPSQKNKLRHLSIISLASNLKCLPYSLLLQQLELKNVRELEDLLIEAVYCDIIHGKLDQRNQQVEVDFSVGRDLGPNELPNIANTLQEWCAGCEAVLCGIEEQVSRANQYRESQLKVKVQVETEVSNLQKTLKASSASPSSGPAPGGAASNQDADQPAEPRDPASSQESRQPGKKSSKVKGLRGSGKIWSKSN